jgi:Raf kinase inhibitor-like YbhB/YbcL family protein
VAQRNLGFNCILLLMLLGVACAVSNSLLGQRVGEKMSITIFSTAFANGEGIPKRFTCDGADMLPQLSWKGSPSNTASHVLIADDPDAPAGTWTHWVLYDLPGTTTELAENVNKVDKLPDGARQGRNDFHKIGYGGPCPPAGTPHRYFFKIYALDSKLNLAPGASKQEVEQAMQAHVLARGELVGKYGRR